MAVIFTGHCYSDTSVASRWFLACLHSCFCAFSKSFKKNKY